MRKRLTFSGILRGEGQEAECTVAATEVSLPGTSASALCEYAIQNVSKPLPEGRYRLDAHGETINLKLREGHWLSDQ